MTLYETRQAATAAEALARTLAGEVAARAAAPGASADAKTWGKCAVLMIQHAEAMAELIPRAEAVERIRDLLEEGEALVDRALDDEIPVASALASLERLQEQGGELWLIQHRLEAWREAVQGLRRCLR